MYVITSLFRFSNAHYAFQISRIKEPKHRLLRNCNIIIGQKLKQLTNVFKTVTWFYFYMKFIIRKHLRNKNITCRICLGSFRLYPIVLPRFFQVGTGAGKNASGSRGNGLRVGTGRATRTSTTTVQPPEEPHTYAAPTSSSGMRHLNVGIVVPYKSFGVREYTKATTSAKYNLARKLKLFKKHDIQVRIVMKEMTPSPTGEWSCGEFFVESKLH